MVNQYPHYCENLFFVIYFSYHPKNYFLFLTVYQNPPYNNSSSIHQPAELSVTLKKKSKTTITKASSSRVQRKKPNRSKLNPIPMIDLSTVNGNGDLQPIQYIKTRGISKGNY